VVAGAASTVRAPLYRDGALLAATAASAVFRGPGGEQLATGGSIVANVATWVIPALTSADWVKSDHYYIDWEITAGGVTYASRQQAVVCRTPLYPVVTDADLTRRHRVLDDQFSGAITTATNLQDYIDEAWTELMNRIYATGRRPQLVVSSSALREVHLYRSLEMVFADLATGDTDEGPYTRLYQEYARKAADAWGQVSWVYDTDDSGAPDKGRRSGRPYLSLAGR